MGSKLSALRPLLAKKKLRSWTKIHKPQNHVKLSVVLSYIVRTFSFFLGINKIWTANSQSSKPVGRDGYGWWQGAIALMGVIELSRVKNSNSKFGSRSIEFRFISSSSVRNKNRITRTCLIKFIYLIKINSLSIFDLIFMLELKFDLSFFYINN